MRFETIRFVTFINCAVSSFGLNQNEASNRQLAMLISIKRKFNEAFIKKQQEICEKIRVSNEELEKTKTVFVESKQENGRLRGCLFDGLVALNSIADNKQVAKQLSSI